MVHSLVVIAFSYDRILAILICFVVSVRCWMSVLNYALCGAWWEWWVFHCSFGHRVGLGEIALDVHRHIEVNAQLYVCLMPASLFFSLEIIARTDEQNRLRLGEIPSVNWPWPWLCTRPKRPEVYVQRLKWAGKCWILQLISAGFI